MGQVQLRGITKRYAQTEVIRGVDLQVRDGEFMVFVGPSGCGKSTILRMIAGLEPISGGELLIDGRRANDLAPSARGAAMVFQNYALYPHMTVAENMGFSLKVAGHKPEAIRAAVGQAAEMLKISEVLARFPRELSGGQRQRVAIGRAIVRKPSVFLFDEPLSNLDAELRVQMRVELSRLHAQLRTTMIYVTHDQVEAMTMGDRIAVFRGGRLAQVGAPLEVYFNPASEFVAQFIGSPKVNLLEASVADGEVSIPGVATRFAAALPVADQARVRRLGIRPENLALAAGGPLEGSVVLTEHLGAEVILYVKLDALADYVTVRVAGSGAAPHSGARVALAPEPAAMLYFDANGDRIAPACA